MSEVHHAIHEHYMTHFLCLTHAQSNMHQLLVKSKAHVNVYVNVNGAANCFRLNLLQNIILKRSTFYLENTTGYNLDFFGVIQANHPKM